MTDTRAITCCFTGHRTVPKEEAAAVRARLVYVVNDLYCKGYRRFVAGGAIGFDTTAAEVVLSFRRHYPDISLILFLPCANQDAAWSEADRQLFEAQRAAADEVVCLSARYYDGCMQKRNQAMVDASSACIAYLTRPRSGAGQTARMAERAGIPVINVAPRGE